MKVKHNIGTVDRVIRVGIAVLCGFLVLSKTVSGVWAVILGIVALVMVFTAITAYCYPYQLLGINTCGCGEHGNKEEGEK